MAKKCFFIGKSFSNACANSQGGSKNVYLIEILEDEETLTIDATKNAVTAINAGVTKIYRIKLRGDQNLFDQNAVSDPNAGTTVVTQTGNFLIYGKDRDKNPEVNKLIKSKPILVFEDRNGNFEAMGVNDGCDVSQTAISNGGAKGDFNGYNITFTATEGDIAPVFSEEAITTLKSLVVKVSEDDTGE